MVGDQYDNTSTSIINSYVMTHEANNVNDVLVSSSHELKLSLHFLID